MAAPAINWKQAQHTPISQAIDELATRGLLDAKDAAAARRVLENNLVKTCEHWRDEAKPVERFPGELIRMLNELLGIEDVKRAGVFASPSFHLMGSLLLHDSAVSYIRELWVPRACIVSPIILPLTWALVRSRTASPPRLHFGDHISCSGFIRRMGLDRRSVSLLWREQSNCCFLMFVISFSDAEFLLCL